MKDDGQSRAISAKETFVTLLNCGQGKANNSQAHQIMIHHPADEKGDEMEENGYVQRREKI